MALIIRADSSTTYNNKHLTRWRKMIWFFVGTLFAYNLFNLLVTQHTHTAIAGRQQQMPGWTEQWLPDFVNKRELPELDNDAIRKRDEQAWNEEIQLEQGEQQQQEEEDLDPQPLQTQRSNPQKKEPEPKEVTEQRQKDEKDWNDEIKLENEQDTKENDQEVKPKHHHIDLQLPAVFKKAKKLPMLFVTVGSNATLNFILNWNKALDLLDLDRLVVALDEDTMRACEKHNIAHMYMPPENGVLGVPKSYWDHYKRIRQVKAFMIAIAKDLLLTDTTEVVVMTDTDIVWQRSPVEYVQQHPMVDWFQHTDCLSVKYEELWDKAEGENPRCGHSPGQSWGRAFNSGLIMIRKSDASIDLLQAWEDALTIGPMNNTMGWIIDDQLALNDLLDIDMDVIQAVEGSPRTVWAYKNSVKMHPLPVLLFSSGHVGFVQRSWEKYGVVPYMVHATFQRHGAQGKVARFNEFGMWHLNPPEYYTKGKFLAYGNNVVEFIDSYVPFYRKKYAVEMAQLHKHMIAMQYQFATLRDAFALAEMTNRLVVLPTFMCYCDNDQSPHIIFECKIRGSDVEFPFKCPSDFLINFVLWEEQQVNYRPENFLEDKRVSAEIKTSVAKVFFKDWDMQRPPYTVSPKAPRIIDLKYDVQVPEGAKEGAIKEAVAAYNDVRVLEFPNLHPRTFGGFDNPQINSHFDWWFQRISGWVDWCCGGVINDLQTELEVTYPPNLAEPWGLWEPRQPERRKDCELAKDDKILLSKERNHPCNFTLDYTHGEL